VTNGLSYEIVTGSKYNVTLTGVSHLSENLSHTYSNGGLSGSWSSSERHVEGRYGSLESKLTTHLVKNKKGSNFLHTLLNRYKSNKISVEFVELILYTLLEHKFINGSSSLGIGHLLHVSDLSLTLLTTDFCSTFTCFSSFLCLTTFGVCFIECVSEFDVVSIVGIGTSSVFEGLSSEGVLVRRKKSRRLKYDSG
jgi:hypothetical protein